MYGSYCDGRLGGGEIRGLGDWGIKAESQSLWYAK